MKFSVIIPCFNSSGSIYRALKSVVSQSYKPYEVLLIDDASEDFNLLLDVVSKFENDLNIKVLRNPCNKNGAYSRNRGIENASGDFVAFLDSDDSWVEERLESALKIITNTENDNFIIYGKFELVRLGSPRVFLPLRGIGKLELVSEYIFAAGQQMQTSTFICSLDIAKNIKFDSNLSRHQDSDFMMRAQEKGVTFIFQKKKCASYFFDRVDMMNRIKSGRINSQFCIHWLKVKSSYFNSKAVAGYRIVVYSRILYLQDNKIMAFLMILKSLPRLGISNFWDLLKSKIAIFFGSRHS
jgi:glycosyltransferase involved in cell wall biosynthesis